MLTRNEIATKMNPLHSFEESSSIFNTDMSIHSQNNLIKKSTFNNNSLNLYLPVKRNIISLQKIPVENNKFNTELNDSVKSIKFPNIKSRANPLYHNLSTRDGKTREIIQSLNNIHEKLNEIENEALNQEIKEEKMKRFNLQKLIKKVKLIKKSIDPNLKWDKAKYYRKLAISRKKDSKPVEELRNLEVSNERLHLQKVILNIEYDNVVNKNKNKKLNEKKKNDSFVGRKYKISSTIKRDNFLNFLGRHVFKVKRNLNIEKIVDKYEKDKNIIDKSYSKQKTSLLVDNDNCSNKKLPSMAQNEYFILKYQNYQNLLQKEELQHYLNRIFGKEEIDKIVKSKKELIMENLKKEYIKYYKNKIDAEELNERNKLNKRKIKEIRKKFYQNIEEAFDEKGEWVSDTLQKYNLEELVLNPTKNILNN